MNLLTLVIKGGYFMVPIALGSLVALAVFIERYIVLRRARKGTDRISWEILALVKERQEEVAQARCRRSTAPVAKVLLAGLEAGGNRDVARDGMAMAGQLEIDTLERRIGWLAIVAAAAPMVGFLGTVTGMIRAFMQVQTHAGQVDASILAGGIWEALVTTAGGLVVGIPALIGNNWLVGEIEGLAHQMRRAAVELLRLVPTQGEDDGPVVV
ncbi:MotA/TolQ/ExbB proton channel family protein [Candidatus Fermentibacteria bacterium]|nr:MotA/TolQ/ExbB proton channel family protein [Candidatus Fermentibacteria bacterium]